MSLSPGVTTLLATALWIFLRVLLFGSAAIALENLALRHQLVVLQRSVPRPRLTRWDRILWVWLSRLWTGWRPSLVIVQPATVLAWHRQGFQLYCRVALYSSAEAGHTAARDIREAARLAAQAVDARARAGRLQVADLNALDQIDSGQFSTWVPETAVR
jgi:hypothetical protein